MTLLTAERLAKRFKDQILLENVSFTLTGSSRIALVGRNGIGKTTLLELLVGIQEPDTGTITRARSCRIEYLEQEKGFLPEQSLFEYVEAARPDLLELRQELTRIQEALERNPYDRALVDRLGACQATFEAEKGDSFESEVRLILIGLGFPEERHRDRLSILSGGEKNRAGLARLLASRGTLLLLDEPTNHLDIESTAWLENYLRSANRAYVIVSHDRAFMTAAVDEVWEMAFGRIDVYAGGFDRYVRERVVRREAQEHKYRHQQEEIARVEDFIRRNMAGQKTKQAKSRLKYLSRIKRIPPPRDDARSTSIRMTSSGRSFHHVLGFEDVVLGYGDTTIVERATFDLYRGDKVGLIGRNGSGKSTILRALIGELEPRSGSLRLGSQVEVAYFDQELSDLNLNGTVLDNLWELDPAAEVNRIRTFLGRFGFTGEESMKAVAALSGGEKTKLSLARLLYHPANFLILDEPTNHLDIDAREAMELALGEYEGTCLIVSHDRYFLDRIVNRVLHLENGRITSYPGNYSYFLEKRAQPQVVVPTVKGKSSESKQTWDTLKEQGRKKTRLKRELTAVRSRLADHERELSELDLDIAERIPRHDWERLQLASNRRKVLESEILELYVKLEVLEAENRD